MTLPSHSRTNPMATTQNAFALKNGMDASLPMMPKPPSMVAIQKTGLVGADNFMIRSFRFEDYQIGRAHV